MEDVQKQHFNFNSRMGNSPSVSVSKNLTICGLTIVCGANVVNEQ